MLFFRQFYGKETHALESCYSVLRKLGYWTLEEIQVLQMEFKISV